jgi:hypothetical protein
MTTSINHDPRTCENSQPCYDCWYVETNGAFIAKNKRTLVREYIAYVGSMIDDGQFDEIEPFLEWVDEERQVVLEYARQGQALNDYTL